MMDVSQEVLQLAQQYLTRVKRSGADNIMAVCPFHLKPDGTPERTPSFAMSLSQGLYFCHSCQEKGNLRTFLKNIGLSSDVIRLRYSYLIEEASKNLPPPPDPLRCKVFDQLAVDEALLGIFDHEVPELLDKGYLPETLKYFEVGFDFAYERITFPLRDPIGRLIGIMGRNHGATLPKYQLYTREYARWGLLPREEIDKRTILWNIDKVYPAAFFSTPGKAPILVVEGFKAAMWCWQAGIEHVVALLGSYLSWEQQWLLERLGQPVYVFLDNNPAGRKGTLKAAERLKSSLDVRVCEYPERLALDPSAQPDSLTPLEVHQVLARAPSYVQWRIQS